MWTPRTPAPLVSIGKAVCGLPRRDPGGSPFVSEWLFAEESSWGPHQSSTSWESDEASIDVAGRGRFHTLGGGSPVRALFPSLEVRRFASPPNLFYQTRTMGFLPISGAGNPLRNPPKIFLQIHRAQPPWRPPRKCGSRLAYGGWIAGDWIPHPLVLMGSHHLCHLHISKILCLSQLSVQRYAIFAFSSFPFKSKSFFVESSRLARCPMGELCLSPVLPSRMLGEPRRTSTRPLKRNERR